MVRHPANYPHIVAGVGKLGVPLHVFFGLASISGMLHAGWLEFHTLQPLLVSIVSSSLVESNNVSMQL